MGSIEIGTESWLAGSKAWLANRKGLTTCRPNTLDVTLFNALHYPNGFIPSGTVLGKVTATGRLGPYSPLLSNGLETALGHLLNDFQVLRPGLPNATRGECALFWEGIVKESALPTFTGAAAALGVIDAAGKLEVPNLRYE